MPLPFAEVVLDQISDFIKEGFVELQARFGFTASLFAEPGHVQENIEPLEDAFSSMHIYSVDREDWMTDSLSMEDTAEHMANIHLDTTADDFMSMDECGNYGSSATPTGFTDGANGLNQLNQLSNGLHNMVIDPYGTPASRYVEIESEVKHARLPSHCVPSPEAYHECFKWRRSTSLLGTAFPFGSSN